MSMKHLWQFHPLLSFVDKLLDPDNRISAPHKGHAQRGKYPDKLRDKDLSVEASQGSQRKELSPRRVEASQRTSRRELFERRLTLLTLADRSAFMRNESSSLLQSCPYHRLPRATAPSGPPSRERKKRNPRKRRAGNTTADRGAKLKTGAELSTRRERNVPRMSV